MAAVKFPKPPQTQQQDRADSVPFLKAANVGKAGKRARLTLAGKPALVNSPFGEQIVLPVTLGKTPYQWGIKTSVPNYGQLFEHLGNNPNKWKAGSTINVVVIKGSRGSDYLAVETE